jgi:serine/threonine-protein kinase
MGLVWSATCPDSEREFAVKMPTPSMVMVPDVRARFEREAAILGSLDAEGVVHLRDCGETAEGVPFMVMDRIAGRSLDKILRRKKILTVSETRSLLAPLLRTLADVHRRGVSHRDIKPANIMVHRAGRERTVTLIDFGVAASSSEAPRHDGRVAGTLHYMSPEQAFGTDQPSPRDDLWSIAVVAYECLTGRMPFDAPTASELFRALDGGIFEPVTRFRPDLSPEVDAFFETALHPRAVARFSTCAAMLDALESLPRTDARPPRSALAAHVEVRALGSAGYSDTASQDESLRSTVSGDTLPAQRAAALPCGGRACDGRATERDPRTPCSGRTARIDVRVLSATVDRFRGSRIGLRARGSGVQGSTLPTLRRS